MTKLQQRALPTALREHQEEQRKSELMVTVCAYHDLPMTLLPVSFGNTRWICDACEREEADAEQAKKDAGDERLLCAVLFEEGEPN